AKADPNDVYIAKLQEGKTQYVNYFSQVINYYTGLLFGQPMAFNTRDSQPLPDYYFGLKEDCDGQGTDFHELLREVFRESLITGKSCVWFQLPVFQESPANLADWEASQAGQAVLKSFDALD